MKVAGQLLANGGNFNCLDKEAIAIAMIEGGILGALSGVAGFGAGALGLRALAGWAAGEAVDLGVGVAWDMAVHQQSFGEALGNNLLGSVIGGVAGVAGHAIGKAWRQVVSRWSRG